MREHDQIGDWPGTAMLVGGARCSFCGRPEALPIHQAPEVTVCEECLRTACKELLLLEGLAGL